MVFVFLFQIAFSLCSFFVFLVSFVSVVPRTSDVTVNGAD
jgi:hypothetical protein